ncbi:hypothetical protein BH23ACT12_BH23ACT12_18020 [soil metagenome]
MSETDDLVQDAVARYLEYSELGGPAPDFQDLPAGVREKVDEVIGMLEQTEGIALRTAYPDKSGGLTRSAGQLLQTCDAEADRVLLAELEAWLPAGTPVDVDGAPSGFALPNLPVAAGWTVGTTGGRVRVWRIDVPAAADLEKDTTHLVSLDQVFRAFSETAAICLVCADLDCLLVEPQDCAPVIEVPAGGVIPRRYRRPIAPVGEALPAYLRELIPAWEALPRFETGNAQALDVTTLANNAAAGAVGAQQALGARARYPKKDVLSALGEAESGALARMAISLYEGRHTAEEIAVQLRKLAGAR